MATTEPKAAANDDAAPLLDVLEEDDEFEVLKEFRHGSF